MPTRAIIGGDLSEPLISAASIIAKVTRDREMILLDQQYPQYGFRQHKGYSTPAHLAALEKFGPCHIHRRSYAPMGIITRSNGPARSAIAALRTRRLLQR